MSRLPKITFDYEYLAGLDDTSAPREVFFLNEPAQKVLSQLAEMVLWTKTRWVNGSEDNIETLAHNIYEQLKVPYHFDDLIPLVDEIESLLRELKLQSGCCPGNIVPFPPTPLTDPGYGYDGPFPTTWGDNEPVADLDDYREILCFQAHRYVDFLVSVGPQLDSMVAGATITVAAIAAVLGALASAGILAPVAYSATAAIASGIIASAVANLFNASSQNIEDERDTIVCAILTGNAQNVEDAVEAVVAPEAWQLFFRWIDYQNAIYVMETGEYNNETLAIGRRSDCDCNPDSGFTFHIPSGVCVDYETLTTMQGLPMNYGTIYKLTGSSPNNGFALEVRNQALQRQGVTVEIVGSVRDIPDAGCNNSNTDPAIIFYNPSLQVNTTVSKANMNTYTGTVPNTGRLNVYGIGCPAKPNKGYTLVRYSAP